MREALLAQISGIEHRLEQDFTLAMAAHFNLVGLIPGSLCCGMGFGVSAPRFIPLIALIAAEQNTITMLEREIANSVVIAPVSGIITTFYAQSTNVVSPTEPVAEITVPGNQNIEVYVSTQDIISISAGDRVRLTFKQRMNDIELYGTVIEIDSTAELRFSALGIEERRVKVTVAPEIPAIDDNTKRWR